MAEMLECSVVEARAVLDTYFHEFPSVKMFNDSVRACWKRGESIRTWGGRVYYPEAPALVDGRMRTWEYKSTNVLVQGSSADLTKEAMIAYYEADNGRAPLLLTVHDELIATAPKDEWEAAMDRLRVAMNMDRLDVPMRSEGYIGDDWGSKVKLEDTPPKPDEPDRPPTGSYVTPDDGTNTAPPYP